MRSDYNRRRSSNQSSRGRTQSNRRPQTNRRRRKKQKSLTPYLVLFVLVIILLISGCTYMATKSDNEPTSTTTTTTTVANAAATVPTSAQSTENATTTTTTTKTTKKMQENPSTQANTDYDSKFKPVPANATISESDYTVGLNILVNNHYKYNSNQPLDQVYLTELPNRKFKLMFDNLPADKFTANQFNAMTQKFKSIYPNDYLGVCSAYRSVAKQQANFNASVERVGEAETLKWYTRPGYSEHHTGFAIDFNTNSYGDRAFTGKGNQVWFKKNCHKYGFILRYTADKKPITEINAEAWHFRQVGIPHADYMSKNNLCLEEYTDFIKDYSYDKPLTVTPDAGGTYYVFYQKATGNDTQINLSGYKKYYCSGNNVDGFVITATK